MPERRPQPNGVLDPRLGVSNKRAICDTCGQGLTECTGHFGYIRLELPVFHIGYFKNTVQILQVRGRCGGGGERCMRHVRPASAAGGGWLHRPAALALTHRSRLSTKNLAPGPSPSGHLQGLLAGAAAR